LVAESYSEKGYDNPSRGIAAYLLPFQQVPVAVEMRLVDTTILV
jgi:hypothetical protein